MLKGSWHSWTDLLTFKLLTVAELRLDWTSVCCLTPSLLRIFNSYFALLLPWVRPRYEFQLDSRLPFHTEISLKLITRSQHYVVLALSGCNKEGALVYFWNTPLKKLINVFKITIPFRGWQYVCTFY